MTSAVSASAPHHATTPSLSTGTTSPQSGAVPAQHPVRSYATATKTATPPTSAGASAPAQHAKTASDTQMNGGSAQGGSQPNNSAMNGHGSDHGRKPSVVISASGASGSYPNGGPVQNGGSRPAISFGSMSAPGAEPQGNPPFQQQNASLPAPRQQHDPRVTSPAHSPSPIPQPPASGGRPPSISGQNNGLAFGSLPADNDIVSNSPSTSPNLVGLNFGSKNFS